ncbi:MAG: aminoacyl-tRNA hydrolase [Eubacteriales bacterium]
MKLIVGLGNPGREYEKSRHNAGFKVIDRLAAALNTSVNKKMLRALVGQGMIGGEKVVLAKPQTYMNLSGESARALIQWFKPDLKDMLVISDDLDLPPGKVRIKAGGGSGGHKGIESIITALGTDNFPRLRLGIGRPVNPAFDPADYVLGSYGPEEAEELEKNLELAAEAVYCFVREGLEKAMNLFNRK